MEGTLIVDILEETAMMAARGNDWELVELVEPVDTKTLANWLNLENPLEWRLAKDGTSNWTGPRCTRC
jgi:hypothetical protein